MKKILYLGCRKQGFISGVFIVFLCASFCSLLNNQASAAEFTSEHFVVMSKSLSEPDLGRISAVAEQELADLNEWFGVQLQGKIQVRLHGDMASYKIDAGESAPGWASALTRSDWIIIGPEAGGKGNDPKKLQGVLRHELTHVLLHALMLGVTPPRWLDEGLAVLLSGEWDHVDLWQESLARIGDALRSGRLFTLDDIWYGFPPDPERARLAYMESYDFVNYLVKKYQVDGFKKFLNEIGQGKEINQAAKDVFGDDLNAIFQERVRQLGASTGPWPRVLYNFNFFIWALMGFLVMAAFIAVMVRRRVLIAGYRESDTDSADEVGGQWDEEKMGRRPWFAKRKPAPSADDFHLPDFNEFMKKRKKGKGSELPPDVPKPPE